MLEICRTCAESIKDGKAIDLYAQTDNVFLHQIEVLTGLWLEQKPELPDYMCTECQDTLKFTVEFRERCIMTQEYLKLQHRRSLNSLTSPDSPVSIVMCESRVAKNGEPSIIDDTCEYLKNIPLQELNEQEIENYEIHDKEAGVAYDEYLSTGEEEEEDYGDNFSASEDIDNQLSQDDDDDYVIAVEQRIEDYSENENENDEILEYESIPVSPCSTVNDVVQELQATENILEENTPKKRCAKRGKYIKWKNLTEEEALALKRARRIGNYICEQCGRHFNCHSNFKLHLLRHTGVKNYPCDVCQERFYTPHLLKRHKIKHTDKRPYACRYCEKTFRSSSSKVKHERNHLNDRPFPCRHCEKRFTCSAHRKDHEVVHTGIRNFQCELCNQAFLRSSHLRQHYRSKFHKRNAQNFT